MSLLHLHIRPCEVLSRLRTRAWAQTVAIQQPLDSEGRLQDCSTPTARLTAQMQASSLMHSNFYFWLRTMTLEPCPFLFIPNTSTRNWSSFQGQLPERKNLFITSPGLLCAAQGWGSGQPAARWPTALVQAKRPPRAPALRQVWFRATFLGEL